jgi:hypothetical protein
LVAGHRAAIDDNMMLLKAEMQVCDDCDVELNCMFSMIREKKTIVVGFMYRFEFGTFGRTICCRTRFIIGAKGIFKFFLSSKVINKSCQYIDATIGIVERIG